MAYIVQYVHICISSYQGIHYLSLTSTRSPVKQSKLFLLSIQRNVEYTIEHLTMF